MHNQGKNISKSEIVSDLENAERVGELSMKGYNPGEISRQTGFPVKKVNQYLREWKQLMEYEASNNRSIADRVSEVLFEVDKHWSLLLKEAWETVEQADQAGQLSTKSSVMKTIHGINKDRVKAFSDVGATQDAELAEEMARLEYEHDVLVELLKEIKQEHPEVSELIATRLGKIRGEVEVLEIESGE